LSPEYDGISFFAVDPPGVDKEGIDCVSRTNTPDCTGETVVENRLEDLANFWYVTSGCFGAY
jgi:hypothetical protein